MEDQNTPGAKPNIEVLLAKVRDGKITEDQFHAETNGTWRDYAAIKGGISKVMSLARRRSLSYVPPKLGRYDPDAEYPSGTIFFEHLYGTTASYNKIISRGEITKLNKHIIYAVTP